MRASADILIHVDLARALAAGIPFFLSANGVVLTAGDERGYLSPEFFSRVETKKGEVLPGWEEKPYQSSIAPPPNVASQAPTEQETVAALEAVTTAPPESKEV